MDCATCEFWDFPWEDLNYSLKEHLDFQHDWDPIPNEEIIRWGVCRKIGHPARYDNNSRKAFTYDGSGYNSGLNTRSDFGCVEWSQKNGD